MPRHFQFGNTAERMFVRVREIGRVFKSPESPRTAVFLALMSLRLGPQGIRACLDRLKEMPDEGRIELAFRAKARPASVGVGLTDAVLVEDDTVDVGGVGGSNQVIEEIWHPRPAALNDGSDAAGSGGWRVGVRRHGAGCARGQSAGSHQLGPAAHAVFFDRRRALRPLRRRAQDHHRLRAGPGVRTHPHAPGLGLQAWASPRTPAGGHLQEAA